MGVYTRMGVQYLLQFHELVLIIPATTTTTAAAATTAAAILPLIRVTRALRLLRVSINTKDDIV